MEKRKKLSKELQLYGDEINYRNIMSYKFFTFGALIITGVILLFGCIFSKYTSFVVEYGSFFTYLIVLNIVSHICVKKNSKHIKLIYYISLLPIYVGGILMGTFFDSKRPAITIMVLICVMTLFIIDDSWRIISYIIAVATLFAVCSFIAKERAVFISDMMDLVIFTSIAIGANYFVLRDRIESASNYVIIKEQAKMDSMTAVLNRGSGDKLVNELVANGTPGAFIILDIDNFKSVNDTFGHQVGDEVICRVSETLKDVFRPTDVIWRLGGDEFAVFAVGLVDEKLCEERFIEIQNRLQNLETSNVLCNSIMTSMGCTIYNKTSMDFEELYKSSDTALYTSKRDGKGKYTIVKNVS